MSRPDDIVGYMFQADVYCPGCALKVYRETRRAAGAWIDNVEIPTRLYPDVEVVFESYAADRGIVRDDEWTYDSDDFPKVVFRDALEGYVPEYCGECHASMLDTFTV